MKLSDRIKKEVDLEDLANRLGLKKGKGSGANWHSPHHSDKTPSLSIKPDKGYWKDYSGGEEAGGSCIDLVMYVQGVDFIDALEWLKQEYGYLDEQVASSPQNQSREEYIADQCLKSPKDAIPYLKQRKIALSVIDMGIKRKTIGFNTYTNPQKSPGEVGYGGEGVAFIARDIHSKMVTGVDVRYLDPELNGGLKTQSQGDKDGAFYCSGLYALKYAHTVYVVESPINALSVLTAFEGQKGVMAIATRGTKVGGHDWSILRGKTVYLCMDNDKPDEQGYRPGQQAAWALHEAMLSYDVGALMIDQSSWEDINDINDYLVEKGAFETQKALKTIETCLIPGLPVDVETNDKEVKRYKRRAYIPGYAFIDYRRIHVYQDETHYKKTRKNDDGTETTIYEPICSFRIASLSKVTIQSYQATTKGDNDAQPNTVFVAAIHNPRNGSELLKKVLKDEQVNNLDVWKKFGGVGKPAVFGRVISLWERAVSIGGRSAANFVGLAYKEGKPQMNNGGDCYFLDPHKQCPYHNLTFHSGQKWEGRTVIDAYQRTMKENAALHLLVHGIGGHMKIFTGFWPHMVLQADKGSGKTTLLDHLQRTLTFTMFSGQSLQTEFRLLTSISHTSHLVGWEELSARRQDIIDKAVSLLQECYGFTMTRRGSDLLEYLNAAPVLLAGEDVPVDSLLGKVVRCDINDRKGDMMDDDLPRWPMRQWLVYLSEFDTAKIKQLFAKFKARMAEKCLIDLSAEDPGAERIVNNYTCLAITWHLMCDFCGYAESKGGYYQSLVAEMNLHVKQTKASRQPWFWVMEIILGEIDSNQLRYPYKFDVDTETQNECLMISATHIMLHLSQTPALKDKYNALTIKTPRVLKKQLISSGIVVAPDVERTINGNRVAHMLALSIDKMEEYGLTVMTKKRSLQSSFV